jgi:predicted RNA-binding Zn-ribbon protein involved in translation (DUF1610 family)
VNVHSPMPTPLNRTLDQELAAILRGVSLECPVCGEFLLHVRAAEQRVLACPECRCLISEGEELPDIELPFVVQAG